MRLPDRGQGLTQTENVGRALILRTVLPAQWAVCQPIRWKCLRRVLCPVGSPVTTLDWVNNQYIKWLWLRQHNWLQYYDVFLYWLYCYMFRHAITATIRRCSQEEVLNKCLFYNMYIQLYYIILYYIILYYIISYHITSHHITSHHITSYHIIYYIILYCTVLYCTVVYYIILYYIILYYTVLYCTVLYCTVLYYIILYYIILYYIILYISAGFLYEISCVHETWFYWGLYGNVNVKITLDWALVREKSLILVPRLCPDISSRACRWESPRFHHRLWCWFPNQRLILDRKSCQETPKAHEIGGRAVPREPVGSLIASHPCMPTDPIKSHGVQSRDILQRLLTLANQWGRSDSPESLQTRLTIRANTQSGPFDPQAVVTCSFLYCNHQVHRELLITLYIYNMTFTTNL
jgi:hypothetical protein